MCFCNLSAAWHANVTVEQHAKCASATHLLHGMLTYSGTEIPLYVWQESCAHLDEACTLLPNLVKAVFDLMYSVLAHIPCYAQSYMAHPIERGPQQRSTV